MDGCKTLVMCNNVYHVNLVKFLKAVLRCVQSLHWLFLRLLPRKSKFSCLVKKTSSSLQLRRKIEFFWELTGDRSAPEPGRSKSLQWYRVNFVHYRTTGGAGRTGAQNPKSKTLWFFCQYNSAHKYQFGQKNVCPKISRSVQFCNRDLIWLVGVANYGFECGNKGSAWYRPPRPDQTELWFELTVEFGLGIQNLDPKHSPPSKTKEKQNRQAAETVLYFGNQEGEICVTRACVVSLV